MTFLIIAFIIILIAILSTAFVIINNLLNQINQLETQLDLSSKELEKVETEIVNHYEFFYKIFTEAYLEMDRVDVRGSFSSDDEVGFAFKVLLTSIENVKEKLRVVYGEKTEESRSTET